jgi:hypothetical protein
MECFFESIEQSLATGNWYGALAVALMIPDICAKMEYGRTSGELYRAWFDAYVKPKYVAKLPSIGEHTFLRAGDCYAFRCSLLHEGGDDIAGQRAREVLERFRFEIPDERGNSRHCHQVDKILILQVDRFSRDIINGARAWLADKSSIPEVTARLASLIQIHPSFSRRRPAR